MADHWSFDYYVPGTDSIEDILDHSKQPNYKYYDTTAIKNHNEEIKKFTNELKQ